MYRRILSAQHNLLFYSFPKGLILKSQNLLSSSDHTCGHLKTDFFFEEGCCCFHLKYGNFHGGSLNPNVPFITCIFWVLCYSMYLQVIRCLLLQEELKKNRIVHDTFNRSIQAVCLFFSSVFFSPQTSRSLVL